MKSIYLIRHGRQCSKRCNVDVPLDEAGRCQAELLGKRLQKYGIQKIYSSRLKRAQETAEIMKRYVPVAYEEAEVLKEIDFGEWTGHEDDYIKKYFKDFITRVKKHEEDLAYPGGEKGEDVLKRVWPVLEKITMQKESDIAIVTHGGVIRCLVCYVTGTPMAARLKFGMNLENTSITHLYYDDETEKFFLERFNDFAHLEPYPELLRESWKK